MIPKPTMKVKTHDGFAMVVVEEIIAINESEEMGVSIVLRGPTVIAVDDSFDTVIRYYESFKDFSDPQSNYAAF
jgi:hypothetical protein